MPILIYLIYEYQDPTYLFGYGSPQYKLQHKLDTVSFYTNQIHVEFKKKCYTYNSYKISFIISKSIFTRYSILKWKYNVVFNNYICLLPKKFKHIATMYIICNDKDIPKV